MGHEASRGDGAWLAGMPTSPAGRLPWPVTGRRSACRFSWSPCGRRPGRSWVLGSMRADRHLGHDGPTIRREPCQVLQRSVHGGNVDGHAPGAHSSMPIDHCALPSPMGCRVATQGTFDRVSNSGARLHKDKGVQPMDASHGYSRRRRRRFPLTFSMGSRSWISFFHESLPVEEAQRGTFVSDRNPLGSCSLSMTLLCLPPAPAASASQSPLARTSGASRTSGR